MSGRERRRRSADGGAAAAGDVPPTGQTGRVEAAIAGGALRRASPAAASFVDLVNAVHRGAGAQVAATEHARGFSEQLFGDQHLVLVLVDGMGSFALEPPAMAPFRDRVTMHLDAVFPATTACAMTTVATGLWPAQHGIPGWWAYLQERDLPVTVLPFVARATQHSLATLGVSRRQLWPHPAQFASVTRDTHLFTPAAYARSVFNRYLSGGQPITGYRSLRRAARSIRRRLRAVQRQARTITYWYIPDFDGACHQHGVTSDAARAVLRDIQELVLKLAADLPANTRVVVTADHGAVDVAPAQRLFVRAGDAVLDCLRTVPSGEGRTPHFHVLPGRGPELVQRLGELTDGRMAVLSRAEAEDLRLFGPTPLSPLARLRFGDYVGVTLAPITVTYSAVADDPLLHQLGTHGGMSGDEMRVPLLVLRGGR